ncbi:MAG: GntR family transcriptional regulator [Deltaproteobacteria bacterium]|jgi:DNA-binding GntR family transcriptional regulator|nr:GntR family transcriptional regulator [Deltaproteobacteria bacterium]
MTENLEPENMSIPKLSLISQKIIAAVIQRKLKKGNRITELELTKALGISRTPIRKALRVLVSNHFFELIPNKGYFLTQNPQKFRFQNAVGQNDSLWLYESIAKDRFLRQLPDLVQENFLLKRYQINRGLLKKVLAQIAEAGWIEKRLGYGWHFLPMIDSPDAYRDSYELRSVIEPEGILSPRFNIDYDQMERLLEAQIFIKEKGYRTLSIKELVKTNAEFHEAIAAASDNRFYHQTVQRQNFLRQVLEMFLFIDRDRVRVQATEHIKIICMIREGKQKKAALEMKKHLKEVKEFKLKDPMLTKLFKSTIKSD